ncbi:hypothetical protein KSP40_PGU008308 [Platanthera guangdongensis]|uniref:Uncharacterized protein n=1 Tax=Platanthera guangdongensis TaxID=2320717 RepID=A0ABR2MBR0_9ASPA
MTAALPSGQIQPGYDQDYFQRKPETAFLYGHVSAQDDRLGDYQALEVRYHRIIPAGQKQKKKVSYTYR